MVWGSGRLEHWVVRPLRTCFDEGCSTRVVHWQGKADFWYHTTSVVRVSSVLKPSPMPPVQLVCPCHISSGEMWLLKGLSGSGLGTPYILLILSKNSYCITVLGMELVAEPTFQSRSLSSKARSFSHLIVSGLNSFGLVQITRDSKEFGERQIVSYSLIPEGVSTNPRHQDIYVCG